MPKLLVLFDPHTDDIAPLADAIAEGARSVRFAEVDVRRVAGAEPATRANHRSLESSEALAQYDGIILGVRGDDGEGVSDALATTTSLVNKVGSVFTSAPDAARRAILWPALAPMAERGMILVPPPFDTTAADQLESARALGKRVAEVVGWVTHARSHHHHH